MKRQPPVSRTVVLRSGAGAVVLTVTTDLLRLTPADREFVYGLIDKLAAYEAALERTPEVA